MSQAETLIPQLEAADGDDEVLALMDGVPFIVFELLDEKPGLFDGDYRQHTWHIKLRQVRNDPGNDLFDRLTR